MNDKEFILDMYYRYGREIALSLEKRFADMNGTEINAERNYIPAFTEAIKTKNMLERKAGFIDGFVCKSSAGRVVRLIQNYDSDIYPTEPEDLPAQWGFVWSKDPEHALPFIALSTSPYGIGDCCTHKDKIWVSNSDNNVTEPGEVGALWDEYKSEVS